MHTESSHRFERGVDPGDVARVLDRAVALTTTLAGGAATQGRVHVQGSRVEGEPSPIPRRSLNFRARKVGDVTGVDVSLAESLAILQRLGCEPVGQATADACELLIPTHRPDIGREVDLVEEVIRVHGMEKVPTELPAIRASRDVGGFEELSRRAKETGAAVGLSEAITFSFTSSRVLEILSAPEPFVTLENPMAEHQSVLRTTLLVGLLDAVKNARRRGEQETRLFTVGPVFLKPLPSNSGSRPKPETPTGMADERLRIAFALAGDRPAWLEKTKPFDVWDAKGYALEIARRLTGKVVEIVPAGREGATAAPAHLHPRGAAFVQIDGQRVGAFGPLHPDVVESLELDGDVLVFEMDIGAFAAGAAQPKFAAIPRFPASSRDIALVVKDGIAAGEVEAAVRAAAGPLAESVRIFDRFVGGQVPAGHASLAFRVVYRSAERTLTDAEVDAAHANVVKEASSKFGATLRT